MAKLMNEIEKYGDEASGDLKSGFLKVCRAAEASECCITTLAAKWFAILRNETPRGVPTDAGCRLNVACRMWNLTSGLPHDGSVCK